MLQRPLGTTGLRVSALGLGCGHIGDPALADADAERLIHGALDLGVTFFDTARSYGLSERRLGHALRGRHQPVVLSTKGGYGVPGVADWTPAAITAGVELARRTLDRDVIDIFHLHSCPLDVLQRPGLLDALREAQRRGHVRVAAYSGEGDPLARAAAELGAVQTSVNLCDQGGLAEGQPLAQAVQRGVGVLAKRALANAPWRFAERPVGHYAEVYWERLQHLGPPPADGWLATAVRFACHAPGVSSALCGTSSLAHLGQAAAACQAGPLPEAEWSRLRHLWHQSAAGWTGQI